MTGRSIPLPGLTGLNSLVLPGLISPETTSTSASYAAATNIFNTKFAITNVAYSESNLRATWSVAATNPTAILIVPRQVSGSWLLEFEVVTLGSQATIAVVTASALPAVTDDLATAVGGVYGYVSTGSKVVNTVTSAYGASYTTGDKIGMGWNADAGTMEFFKNGASQGIAFTGISGLFLPACGPTSGFTTDMRVSTTLSYTYAGYLQWR